MQVVLSQGWNRKAFGLVEEIEALRYGSCWKKEVSLSLLRWEDLPAR